MDVGDWKRRNWKKCRAQHFCKQHYRGLSFPFQLWPDSLHVAFLTAALERVRVPLSALPRLDVDSSTSGSSSMESMRL